MKQIYVICLVSFLCNFGFLFLTGKWWDDWGLNHCTPTQLFQWALEMGRPSVYYTASLIKFYPLWVCRLISFVMFMFMSVAVWFVCRNLKFFSREDSFVIAVLFTAMPFNDARAIASMFLYTVGMFFYWSAFCVLIVWLFRWKFQWEKYTLVCRFILWFLFLLSFTFNSNLCYYALCIGVIFYKEYSTDKRGTKLLRRIPYYSDFILLPILFWMMKSILFPPFGYYSGYNAITVVGILKAAVAAPISWIYALKCVWNNYNQIHMALFLWGGLISVVTAYMVMYKKYSLSQKSCDCSDIKTLSAGGVLVGIIVTFLGMFPYMVVRHTVRIGAGIGVAGRDGALLPLGVALLLLFIIKRIFVEDVQRYVLLLIVLLGIIFHAQAFLRYQLDTYWQQAFMAKIRTNNEIREAKNIVVIQKGYKDPRGPAFYSMNGMVSEVFGKEDKCFFEGYRHYEIIQSTIFEKMRNSENPSFGKKLYNLNEYDLNYTQLDGELIFDCSLGFKDGMYLKYLELFDPEQFDNSIASLGKMSYQSFQTWTSENSCE